MLKRIITGAGFVAVITGFFFLRLIDVRLFEILILLFSVIGTYEVARAMGERIISAQKWLAVIFSGITAVISCFFGAEYALYAIILSVMVQLALAVISHERVTIEGLGCAVLSAVYPSALLVPMSATNALGDFSTSALLLIFIVSPFTDTFAFFVGSLLKGPKLCPKVSPKKTVSGAVGGLIGGIIGGLGVYFIYGVWLANPVPSVWIFVAAGLIGALLTEFGDLVESIIKRKVGIKDMGKILPGHGGVMDRIDGILFAAPFIFACFKAFLIFFA